MNIDLQKMPVLWYEDGEGKRYVQSQEEMERMADPPQGFVYQNSQFPNVLHHSILKSTQEDEVAACEHPPEKIRPTYGWIDGVEGRECVSCGGIQLRDVGIPWPEEWDTHGSRSVMLGESSWPEDLVLAMATKTWLGWLRRRKVYTLGEAIRIAANACGRCLNVLGHRYGVGWGYAEGSEEWVKCGTECQFCKGLFFARGTVGK